MNWQENDMIIEQEENFKILQEQKLSRTNSILSEQKKKADFQLWRYRDPSLDINRLQILNAMERFGILMLNQKLEEISSSLLAKGCESFVFNSSRKGYVSHTNKSEGFFELFKEKKVTERHVREINVDVEKRVGFQIIESHSCYDDEGESVSELSLEVFNFDEELRITRFREIAGRCGKEKWDEEIFETSRKALIRQKITQINATLAGQPDMEAFSSFLMDSTEYKLYSWDQNKCFIFYKHNLASEFKNTEERIFLKQIVPYEIWTDGKRGGVGSYVYYLEDKAGEKFLWFSRIVYFIDDDGNITKIFQQGELFPEGSTEIPFEAWTRERIHEKLDEFNQQIGPNYDIWYSNLMNFDCSLARVGFYEMFKQVYIKHFNDLNHKEATSFLCKDKAVKDWSSILESYIDYQDSGYEVALSASCAQGTVYMKNHVLDGQVVNLIIFSKKWFENGKISKMITFICPVNHEIPSPFDDQTFSAKHIKPKIEQQPISAIHFE